MRDGEPISWQHFVYGTAHLARAYARDSLRAAGVMRMNSTGMGYATDDARQSWTRTMRTAAGW